MAKKAKSHDRLSDLLAIMKGMDASPNIRRRVGLTLLHELSERIFDDLGVEGRFHYSYEDSTTYDFCGFRNRSGTKGNGATAMTEWLVLTDEIGMSVHLQASDRGSGKLFAYYESFGFQPQEEQNHYIRPASGPYVLIIQDEDEDEDEYA